MDDCDLDEVVLSILDTIAMVRQFVRCPDQVERLIKERLESAFEMIDSGEIEFLDAVIH